jgi:adenylate cyclase
VPSIGKPRRGPLGLTLSLGILTFLVISVLSFLNPGQTLENHALDLAYRFRPPESAPSALIIVGIDEPSFQELQLPWPWPRKMHAELIRRLNDAGAALSLIHLCRTDDSAEDQLFAAMLSRERHSGPDLKVTVSRQFSSASWSPLSLFEQAARDVKSVW